jgi:nucleoside-diphosphate-sugar epimerase
MNILITGIHGFVGSNFVEALKDKHAIYGLDIIALQKEGITQTYNWNELDKLPKIDAVIHLAGKAHDTKNQAEAKVYFDVNFGLTQKIYDWFLQSDAQKFIFFSSVKAAADVVKGNFLIEDVEPKPVGAYGESKIAAERYIQNHASTTYFGFAQQPLSDRKGKQIYILRPAMTHGKGNKGNLNLLYSVVKKGVPYPLGAFENKRSFTSIDNLSFVVEQLLEKDIPSGIYNMADDETLSTNELIRLIAKTLNKSARIWNWSPKFMKNIAKMGTLLYFPLNSERLQKLTENYVVSNEKIKKALGIDKMPISAMKGFEITIKSFENDTK